jgi:hypothetical protein
MDTDDVVAEAPVLDHLLPGVRQAALLPAAERIQRVRAERWIGYSKAHEALNKLEQLFTHPPRQRMPNLLLIGPTNNGKTMIIEKFRRLHPAAQLEDSNAEDLPIVSVQMPSEPTVTRFYAMLLYSMHAPPRPRARVTELEGLTLRIMQRTGVRILVIDELHNLLAGSPAGQREFLGLIRFLGNALRIPIIGVGTKEAYLAIRSDDQLENRFEPFILPRWQANQELASLLASFLAVLPLQRRSDQVVSDLLHYILDRTEGTIGEIATLLTRAAVLAIETGEECIHRDLLLAVDYDSPTERRHAFERELA